MLLHQCFRCLHCADGSVLAVLKQFLFPLVVGTRGVKRGLRGTAFVQLGRESRAIEHAGCRGEFRRHGTERRHGGLQAEPLLCIGIELQDARAIRSTFDPGRRDNGRFRRGFEVALLAHFEIGEHEASDAGDDQHENDNGFLHGSE